MISLRNTLIVLSSDDMAIASDKEVKVVIFVVVGSYKYLKPS